MAWFMRLWVVDYRIAMTTGLNKKVLSLMDRVKMR